MKNKICTIAGCEKQVTRKKHGYCEAHYTRMRRHGNPESGRASPDLKPPSECKEDSCSKQPYAKGLCIAHYTRMRRHGSATGGSTGRKEAIKWLEDHSGYDLDDCIEWPYSRSDRGYGLVTFKGRQIVASRAICILAHGEPPTEKHEAAHSCGNGNKGCVNPKHLRWATRTENHADKRVHGTDARGERHPMCKLNEKAVKLIRLSEGRHSARLLALEYGVSVAMIYRIWRRQAWRHI